MERMTMRGTGEYFAGTVPVSAKYAEDFFLAAVGGQKERDRRAVSARHDSCRGLGFEPRSLGELSAEWQIECPVPDGTRAAIVAMDAADKAASMAWAQAQFEGPCPDCGRKAAKAALMALSATVEEAAPAIERQAVADRRKADVARVQEIVWGVRQAGIIGAWDEAALPGAPAVPSGDGVLVWTHDPRSGSTGGRLVVCGDDVHALDAGYYDDYRHSHRAVTDAALAAEVREMAARAGVR